MRAKAWVHKWLAAGDDRAALDRLVKKRRRLDRHRPPRPRATSTETLDIGGFPLHILASDEQPRSHVVLYLHGGAYIIGPTGAEWSSARKLATSAQCDVALWDYPKAPEFDCETTLGLTADAFSLLVDRYEQVAVVGASAGGGLAGSLLIGRAEAGLAPPAATVMFSPWLDLSISDPRAADLEPLDHVLSIDGLRRDGELYAGPRDVRDPEISPLFASTTGSGPVQVHVGTHEILLHDCEAFVRQVNEAGGRADLVVDPLGQHVSALFPTPEGKRLRTVAATFIAAELGRG